MLWRVQLSEWLSPSGRQLAKPLLDNSGMYVYITYIPDTFRVKGAYMAPKSERFELRLDEDILARVDKWRSEQPDLPSRAEAMRRLVEAGLAGGAKQNVVFSDGEKLIAMMLRDLYRHHKVKGEIDPDFIQDVIVGGHFWAPRWEMQGLFHDHTDSADDVRFVVDVLDMWSFVQRAHGKLSAKERARVESEADPFGKHVKFPGFDGNNESELMSIARFFVEKMDRFSEFKGGSFNSHMPTVAMYRRMLGVFDPLRKTLVGVDLSADQLIAILKSMKYPE